MKVRNASLECPALIKKLLKNGHGSSALLPGEIIVFHALRVIRRPAVRKTV